MPTAPFHVVLVEPRIPQNTGTIGRLCVAAGATLHLVGPLGFEIDDARRRRAGLDYWPHLEWRAYGDLDEFRRSSGCPEGSAWYLTARGGQPYAEARFEAGDWLWFGTETVGLPPAVTAAAPGRCLTIPMRPEARSLNLSIAAGVVLYEALRQTGWPADAGGDIS